MLEEKMSPGKILKKDFLEPMGLTQVELAQRMGVSIQRINTLINQKRNITAETAILLNRIASWVQEEHEDPIIARKSPKKRSLRDNQLFFLQGLQNTGLKKAKILLDSFNNTPLNVIQAIVDSNVIYTRTGNPKGIKGPLKNIRGFSSKYILENKKLLSEEDENNSG